MHGGRITYGRQTRTFQEFYVQTIDKVYATPLLEELLTTERPETQGIALIGQYWQRIQKEIEGLGVVGERVEVVTFLTYCLYWWQNFGKGYVREMAVFRDLEQSGILFEAHDLRDPVQRRSAYDLTVLSQRGDIKTSSYFLHHARFFPLRCDFYLIRLFDATTKRWLDIILLKRAAWHQLNGEPLVCSWERVASLLPTVVQVVIRGETLVVVPYEVWKTRVLAKQHPQETPIHEHP